MGYGWTKKYKPVNLDDLIQMIQEDQEPNSRLENPPVIYFKYVIRYKTGWLERKSLELKYVKN